MIKGGGWGGQGFQWSKISVAWRGQPRWCGGALEEGLDGPLFQNGLERGQGAVERVCMIHQLGDGGG